MYQIRQAAINRLSRAASSIQRARLVHSWREAEQTIRRLHSDAYTILGINEKSSMQEIKAQYYRICRQLHPDTQTAHQQQPPPLLNIEQTRWSAMSIGERQSAMREQFGMVRDAYEILANAQVRHKYDAMRQRQDRWKARRRDPWASEQPMFTGKKKSPEEARKERLLLWGVFGFLGIVLVMSSYQRLLTVEKQRERLEKEHYRSTRMLQVARERALEKWCQVPPDHLDEYEFKRLASAQKANGEMQQGDFHLLWPDGVGLGLIALLDEKQLCGVLSRSRVTHDEALARLRPTAQRALQKDPIVAHYINNS
ncbi:hypothetical protein IWW36_006203 [Coemansia brasiliensis]|uniref:J domain-containing protein n=1 Tax=Coemansia brasiliensis TaxID=2650707 RepID=A0A9W8I262_9FUNG|nr:hypothetical protein IWW36_006203 [Coemansia brasiliensis]